MIWVLLIILGTLIEGEITLVAAGFALYWEKLDMGWVIGAATLGAWLGDWFFFELGRRRGDSLFKRYPRLAKKAEKISRLLVRWPVLTIFILRFQIAMRMVGNFAMATGGLNRNRFLILNFFACMLWAGLLTLVCFWFASIMVPLWSSVLGV